MRYPKAPSGARLLASLIDGLIASLPLIALGVAAALLAAMDGSRTIDGGGLPILWLALGVPLTVAAVVWAIGYTHVKDGMRGGQSWGKRWTGLMVVHLRTDQPCSRWQSAVRKLVWAGLMAIPVVGWLVEPLAALLREDGRRIGDHVADTQVVARADYERSIAERVGDRWAGAAASYGAVGAPAMDPYEAALLRDAMREVDEITRAPR